ncbi:MAG TPA: hypothetical protein VKR61_02080 [Bryobacteraceae bacterium]|nr:hypothetical protein [Bryobacteraceae bacterium]
MCLPALAAAEDRCPWLNRATAGGVLGGAVRMTVTPTSCQFVHEGSELLIEVQPASQPHAACESDSEALKAIGNEAVACAYRGKPGWVAEQVVGRVRDQTFLVRISRHDPQAPAKVLREKACDMAEQVAGSLF